MLKKQYIFLFSLILFLFHGLMLEGQHTRCATNEVRKSIPNLEQKKAAIEKQISSFPTITSIKQRSIITIPVVVHVVWNKAEENISDEQILSQIEVLNQDFRAKNAETNAIPSEFQSLLADAEIEFCLVKRDYRGRATEGITRTFTREIAIANNSQIIKNSSFGGMDAWDTKRFLNIWVGARDDGILGEASLPGEVEEELDGVVIDYRVFGNSGVAASNQPFHLGRTLTHEIGHYLGLQHLWGEKFDNSNCREDDGIDDTPIQRNTYANQCPNDRMYSCDSPDMYMNFMNYTNDACMSMFTLGQKARMVAVLNTVRKELIEAGEECKKISSTNSILTTDDILIYPNPISSQFHLQINFPITKRPQIHLFDAVGKFIKQVSYQPKTPHSIDIGNIPSGIYYIRIYIDNQIVVKKISIIQI